MQQVRLSGTFSIAPPTVSESTFPGGVFTGQLSTLPAPKQAPVYEAQNRNLNSANAYVGLSGVGPADSVTKGNTLYIRTSNLIWIRLTFSNLPSDIVSEIPVQGMLILEIPDNNALILLEAKGTGYIEYACTGNQLTGY